MNSSLPVKKLSPLEITRAEPGADSPLHPIRIVVENVRSAFNVGSILRTADAIGVEQVYLVGYTPDGNHRGVHKSALGAQDQVSWSHHADIGSVMDILERDGVTPAAVEITSAPSDPRSVRREHYPIALIVGNEVSGISDRTLARCQLALELPQYGVKHSLNVAVALGVVGYDVLRRWHEITAEPA